MLRRQTPHRAHNLAASTGRTFKFPPVSELFGALQVSELGYPNSGIRIRQQRSILFDGGAYPFTPPAAMPWTRYLCRARNPATTGMLTTIAAAISWFQ